MKHVVSVSLGTSRRDKASDIELDGETYRIERRGTDGDLDRFAAAFRDLDGKVDALGIGGADLDVVVGSRRYRFRQIARLVAGARTTPVVDGSGLKHTLEREAIRTLQREGTVDFARSRVLLVSAVDRFGMAEALLESGADVSFGDLMFAVGIPVSLRTARSLETLGRIVLPIATRLPFKWFYPTGEKQEARRPRFPRAFHAADVIAGDWHFIHRYAPDRLDGKTVLTQTLRRADLEWLRAAGARRAITTTPLVGGETFATNVMEAVLVARAGRGRTPLTEADYRAAIAALGWRPNVLDLAPVEGSGTLSGPSPDSVTPTPGP